MLTLLVTACPLDTYVHFASHVAIFIMMLTLRLRLSCYIASRHSAPSVLPRGVVALVVDLGT